MSSAEISTIEESAASAALFALCPEAEPTLRAYAEILAGRGIEWGLMGPREGDKIWGRHISNSLALADLRSQVGGIDLPTLIVAGSADPVTTVADSRFIQAAIAGARLAEVPASHLSNLEAPQAFDEALAQFLRG